MYVPYIIYIVYMRDEFVRALHLTPFGCRCYYFSALAEALKAVQIALLLTYACCNTLLPLLLLQLLLLLLQHPPHLPLLN